MQDARRRPRHDPLIPRPVLYAGLVMLAIVVAIVVFVAFVEADRPAANAVEGAHALEASVYPQLRAEHVSGAQAWGSDQ